LAELESHRSDGAGPVSPPPTLRGETVAAFASKRGLRSRWTRRRTTRSISWSLVERGQESPPGTAGSRKQPSL